MTVDADVDKTPFISRARLLLARARERHLQQPPRVTEHECAERCLAIHLIGSGGPIGHGGMFDGNEPIWGIGARYDVLADFDVHKNEYVRVWCSFPSPDGSVHVDVSDALT